MNKNWAIGLTNLTLTPILEQQLSQYYKILIAENKKYNLTTIIEEMEVYYKHFYDSLLISNNIILEDQNICDVGSGAGIPGIILKICFPKLQLTIIESNTKKCQFLKTVITELNLENVYIINQRAETFAHQYRETFDIVTARALAPLNILSELCLGLVKVEGLFIAYKGLKVEEELALAQNSINTMGAKLINQFTVQLPNNYGQRTILHFQKYKLCALKYPRPYQQIKSKPL
ncbi:16S rRNA (guanine(527)-N(7))-methyltransferase RsmG [Spiroplasma endosymbiont of Lasioglossum malachurum]|uniref:16S rRNA (guanine(527)-N(7))-methyltransferase RsmG n=1 Tax=Spiroplasma endosymbiont of Lasioglossum malachurum TaxID=3066319 RepID=UPI0030D36994